MLLSCLAAAAVLTPAQPTVAIVPRVAEREASSSANPALDHGKIEWFQGTFEEALARAKSQNQFVFVDFWTSWCGWCKKLDKDTFSDDGVVASMKDVVCVSIDAESKSGAPVAKRYAVSSYPSLLMIAPDGTPEDKIGGYLQPDKFKAEVQRVRSGQGTTTALRKLVEADGSNVDKRFDLARKLRDLGDTSGYDAQMAEIKKLDPEGKSLPMRRQAFDEVIAKIDAGFQKDRSLDTAAMVSFLEKETLPAIRFDGFGSLARMHAYLAQQADQTSRPEDAKLHRAETRKALRSAWAAVPEDQTVKFGSYVAASFIENRAELSEEEKTFALAVAEKVVNLAKDDVELIDLYAVCLHTNGKKEDALKQIERCVQLDPKNPQWKTRQSEFQ